MKKFVSVLILLLAGIIVIAGNGVWNFYAGNTPYSFFGLTPYKEFDIQVVNDGSIPEDKLIDITVVKSKVEKEPVVVLITEKGFQPQIVNLSVGQRIVWKNKQTAFKAIIAGVREAEKMRSKTLEPNDFFTWNFSKAGEYNYVDVVIIGRTGKVIVKE
tara:strand:- start:47 stop:520 length:474 start_codon:yes stop_codon:yes gene_type:complete